MFPTVINRWKRNFLLVSLDYHVENRRPDLDDGAEAGMRYKHWLRVRVLWRTYRWTFRTRSPYSNLPYS